MSTEEGHQSRGGLKRHKKMGSGSGSHGAKQAMTTAFANPEKSTKATYEASQREAWSLAAARRGEASRLRRLTAEWLQALDPLSRENAELLIRQQIADGRAEERKLAEFDVPGFDDEEDTDGLVLRGFLRGVWFDRADDAWPFYAGQQRRTRVHRGYR